MESDNMDIVPFEVNISDPKVNLLYKVEFG